MLFHKSLRLPGTADQFDQFPVGCPLAAFLARIDVEGRPALCRDCPHCNDVLVARIAACPVGRASAEAHLAAPLEIPANLEHPEVDGDLIFAEFHTVHDRGEEFLQLGLRRRHQPLGGSRALPCQIFQVLTEDTE